MNSNELQRILVAGGTGMLGAPVVRRLAADGFRIRVLARDTARARAMFSEPIEIVVGDVTDPRTLPPAVSDCFGLYVSLRGNFESGGDYTAVEGQGLADLLSAARDAGVQRVANISGAGDTAGNEDLLPVRIKLRSERLLRESGMEWTVFRCTHFMESLDLFVRGNKAVIIGKQPHAYHYIAADDYAAMVSRAFALDEAVGRTFTVWGPQALTMEQALKVYIRELRPELKLGRVPVAMLRLISTLTRNRDLRFLADLFASFTRVGETGDPAPANALLGTPQTTLEQWCAARRGRA